MPLTLKAARRVPALAEVRKRFRYTGQLALLPLTRTGKRYKASAIALYRSGRGANVQAAIS